MTAIHSWLAALTAHGGKGNQLSGLSRKSFDNAAFRFRYGEVLRAYPCTTAVSLPKGASQTDVDILMKTDI